MTSAVAVRLLSTQSALKRGRLLVVNEHDRPRRCPLRAGCCAGPTTRLARIASAPATSKIERLRMYSLHPSGLLRTLARPRLPASADRAAGQPSNYRPRARRSRCLRRHGQVQDHTSVTYGHRFSLGGFECRIPGDDQRRADTSDFVAAEDVGRLRGRSRPRCSIEPSVSGGTSSTEMRSTQRRSRSAGSRRARGGEKGGPTHGDEAVRAGARRTRARRRSSGSRAGRSRTWTRRASPRRSSRGSRPT